MGRLRRVQRHDSDRVPAHDAEKRNNTGMRGGSVHPLRQNSFKNTRRCDTQATLILAGCFVRGTSGNRGVERALSSFSRATYAGTRRAMMSDAAAPGARVASRTWRDVNN